MSGFLRPPRTGRHLRAEGGPTHRLLQFGSTKGIDTFSMLYHFKQYKNNGTTTTYGFKGSTHNK